MYRLLDGKSMFDFLADFSGNGKHISLVKSRWNKYSMGVYIREVMLSVICNISRPTLKFIIPEQVTLPRRSFLLTVNN